MKKVFTFLLSALALLAFTEAAAVTQRTTVLDFTANSITYADAGGTKSDNPLISNILDSSEGWQWYLNAEGEYKDKTLVLDGLDLSVNNNLLTDDPNAALVVPDGTTIIVQNSNAVETTFSAGSAPLRIGLYCGGTLTIEGTGTLNFVITGTRDRNAIAATGTTTVRGTSITSGTASGSFGTISLEDGASLTSNAASSTGLKNTTLTLVEGSLQLVGKDGNCAVGDDCTINLPENKDYGWKTAEADSYASGTTTEYAYDASYTYLEIVAPYTGPAWGGSGTVDNPYTISNEAELRLLATNVNDNGTTYKGEYFELADNITLTEEWVPIGTSDTKSFQGSFDGKGHVISNLKIGESGNPSSLTTDAGLFGNLSSTKCVVENLGVDVSIYTYGQIHVGGITGSNNGATVENCYVTGTIFSTNTSTLGYCGGIVGYNKSGGMRNCYNTANITNDYTAGGIVGNIYSRSSTVEYCYNTGNVTNTGSRYASGISGNSVGMVKNCVTLGLKVSAGQTARIGIGTLAGNKAREDQKIGNIGSEAIPTDDKTATEKNGEDVALGTPLATVFAGWDTDIWDIPASNLVEEGALPTLKVASAQSPVSTLPKAPVIDYTLYYNSADSKLYTTSTFDGSTEYTEQSDKWEGNGSTLILKGLAFETSATRALVVPDGVTITLANGTTSTISSTYDGEASAHGVYANGSLTIGGGTGTLNAIINNPSSKYETGFAIYVRGSFNLNGGIVTATGQQSKNNGLNAGGVGTVSGGELMAYGGCIGIQFASDEQPSFIVSGTGVVQAKGEDYAILGWHEADGNIMGNTSGNPSETLKPAIWDEESYKIDGEEAHYIKITAVDTDPGTGTYHTITLEVADGIDLYNQTAGELTKEDGDHLYLQFLPEDRSLTADDILFLIDGVETSFKHLGEGHYFTYILNPIKQDHTILIALKEYPVTLPEVEGVTYNIGAGTHQVAYGETFTFSLTLDDTIDPADVHVYSNGIEIQPDALRSITLTYTIDKVITSITIVIEGAGEPTGNAAIAEGKVGIVIENGDLRIENYTEKAVDVAVYNVNGQNVVSLRGLLGSETINLKPGIYLLKVGDTVYKVAVN